MKDLIEREYKLYLVEMENETSAYVIAQTMADAAARVENANAAISSIYMIAENVNVG